MSFEVIINRLSGRIGIYQVLVLILFGIYIKALAGIQVFLPVFVAYKQDYQCALNISNHSNFENQFSNNIFSHAQCSVVTNSSDSTESGCEEWIFDQSIFQSTVRSQFGLVCEREWLVSLGSTLVMLGTLIGSMVFGILSDRFGRFTMLMVVSTIATISAFGEVYVPYFWAYNCLRFFIGFATAGVFISINTYISELAPQSHRIYYLMVSFSGYSVGGCILCTVAYFQRNHFTIQLICACLWIPVFLFPLLFTESPRWLVIRGHKNRAWSACRKISKVNRRSFMERKEFEEHCQKIKDDSHDRKQSLDKIFRYAGLRRVSFVVWYCFSVGSFVYYIISFGSGSLGIDVFLNFGLMSVFESPFRIAAFFLSIKFGRIKIMVTAYLLSGIFILLSGVLYGNPDLSLLLMVFSQVNKISISIAFDMIWTYSLDIYPTVARTSGIGAASTCARVASLLSPQMENLLKIWPPLPFIITGTFPLLAGILSWRFLPETFKMRTKDYLEETEDFIRKWQSNTACFSRNCLCCQALNDLEILVNGTHETEQLNKEDY